jgi:hypothetical protein
MDPPLSDTEEIIIIQNQIMNLSTLKINWKKFPKLKKIHLEVFDVEDIHYLNFNKNIIKKIKLFK